MAPFSVPQIRTFLTKWFEMRPLNPTRRKEQVESLVERLVTDERMTSLRALSRRPAYLASLAFVHGTRGALPHTRAALYESVVDAYIDVLDRQRGIPMRNWDRQEKRDVLAAVAYEAHVGATAQHGHAEDRRFAWSRAELERAVAGAIDKGKARFRTVRFEDAKELTDYYLARTGLIVETSEGRFQFGHLSFQEYLTALYALDRASGARDKAEALEKLLLDRLDKAGWIEVTLLALAVDAGRTQGTGHRTMLQRLNPHKLEHMRLLRTVLSGEEVPLSDEERRAWLVAYMIQAAGFSQHYETKHLVNLEKNRRTIEDAWHTVIEAFIAGTSVADALRRLLPPASVDKYEDEIGTLDPLKLPRSWAAQADSETLGTWVLRLPLQVELVPAEAQERLLSLAKARSWFSEDPALPGIPIPDAVWTGLNEWARQMPEVMRTLVERLPFTWLCADDSLNWAATPAARWDGDSCLPLVRSRSHAWRSVLAAERWGLVARADLALTRVLDRTWAVERPMRRDRRMFMDFKPSPARGLSLAWALAVELSVELRPDRSLVATPILANCLQTNSLSMPGKLCLARTLPHSRALVDVWWQHDPTPRSWQERAAAIMTNFYLGTAINEIVSAPPPTPRAAVEAERAAMADPDYLGRDLTDPADRAQARKEWTDFLRSPLSPIPMLDAILATDFTEIDASTKAITERFEREAEVLLREAGAPVPPPSR